MHKTARILGLSIAAVLTLAAVIGLLLIFAEASQTYAEIRGPIAQAALSAATARKDSPRVLATVPLSPGIGIGPVAIGVNPATGYGYVANPANDDVTIISGTHHIATHPAGENPTDVGVDPDSGYVYIMNFESDDVTVIQNTSVITTLAVGREPRAMDLDPATGYVYVANTQGRSISIIGVPALWRSTYLPAVLRRAGRIELATR
jgi:YVTN family beta-propeller protein